MTGRRNRGCSDRGSVFGQALWFERDSTGQLRMPRCVWIVNRHEPTAEVMPATFHTVFLPKLTEGTLGVG